MMCRSLAVIALLAILGLAPTSANAAVSKADCNADTASCFFWIYGEIKQSDVTDLDRLIRDYFPRNEALRDNWPKLDRIEDYKSVKAFLNSSGGDVYAAMEIGRRLRKIGASVTVPESGRCASACVLIMAGATWRMVWGPVVVHRPFSAVVGGKSYDETRASRTRMKTDIARYLTEMDVSQDLLEIMDGVPSDKGRRLSEDELEALRLLGADPATAENSDAWWAELLGITRQELIQRKLRCAELERENPEGPPDTHLNCMVQSQ